MKSKTKLLSFIFLYPLILFLLLVQYVKGQDSLVFGFIPHPNKEYETINSQKINSTLNFKGPSFLIEMFKAKGITFPYSVDGANTWTSVKKTGNKNNNKIPVSEKYLNFITEQKPVRENNKLKNPLDGTQIFGYYYNNSYHLDSIVNPKLDITELETIKIRLVDTSATYMDFPVAIGESFEKKSVESFFLIGAGEIVFEVSTKFILQSIKNGIGYFDTKIILNLKSKNDKVVILPNSHGIGKVEFAIKDQYIKHKNSTYQIFANVTEDGSVMSTALKVENSETTSIKDEEIVLN